MEYIVIAVLLIVVYAMWAKNRGDKFVGLVAHQVADTLRMQGEDEDTITAYLTSASFAAIAKGSFGKQSAFDAAVDAVAHFRRMRPMGS